MTTTTTLLRRVTIDELESTPRAPVDAETLARASEIVEDVRANGAAAIRNYAQNFDNLPPTAPLLIPSATLQSSLNEISPEDRALLERAADRIRAFAQAQRESLSSLTLPIPGGSAGHTIEPMRRAGCYAPGGRHPLPSSVLMTAVTARVAGCAEVIVASPNDSPIMRAAAAIAGADAFLPIGGAHAIAALAHGFTDFTPCDIIVGPGNRWVTAAKQRIVGVAAIDMLAGPSELLIIADETANPRIIAADLLAQAEHDPDAIPSLISLSEQLIEDVERELARQLESLPTRKTARAALANSICIVASTREQAARAADRIAAEHLEIQTADPDA
ncbi:MAG: histidinol dehydrogenase, partial [Planctomycetota bacterium]|nr:histidinol dehydrogenase [Planctomycetota bacterium]